MNEDSLLNLEDSAETSRTGAEPGFYGKLPSKGDFVTRRLPQVFVEIWDEWLQNGIRTSQEKLGEDWLAIYMTSPIWRFALSAGVGGSGVMTGVLMPSVDRVGRYFPLTLAVSLDACGSIAGLPEQGADWYARMEEAALGALEEGAEFESIDARIQDLGHPDLDRGASPALDHDPGINGLRVAVDPAERLVPDYAGLTGYFLNRLYPHCCLWWTAGSDRVVPSLLASSGLPSMGAFVALLDGGWRESGWIAGESIPGDDSLDGII